MRYVTVDCGQTKSEVTVFSDDGMIRSWEEKPVVHPAVKGGMERIIGIVTNILTELLPDGFADVNICFSLSGYHGEWEMEEQIRNVVNKNAPGIRNLFVVPDYVGNWFSVTEGNPGMVIMSGGGTVAYGENREGEKRRLGGWGHLLGDEGSGYWFGLQTIKAALRSMNGLTAPTSLERPVKEHLGTSHEFEIAHLLFSEQVTDADIALLTPALDRAAGEGDPIAVEIIRIGVSYLVELADCMTKQIGSVPIHVSGGVFRAPSLQREFKRQLEQKGLTAPSIITGIKPAEGILGLMKRNTI